MLGQEYILALLPGLTARDIAKRYAMPHVVFMATPSTRDSMRTADRTRLRRAIVASGVFVVLLWLCFGLQQTFDWTGLTVTPHTTEGLVGLLTAPLLHGSFAHILANSGALLMLGTLAGFVYPHASLRALPLLWLGSGLGAWLLGQPASHHLGASGISHGLGFLVFTLGLLRRDRASIAAGMIAFFLYGGMLMTIFPREVGVSWESHLGGALAGVLAAFLFRASDPMPERKKYSWELEEELERQQAQAGFDTFETRAPDDVPVIWQRDVETEQRGTVLPFKRQSD